MVVRIGIDYLYKHILQYFTCGSLCMKKAKSDPHIVVNKGCHYHYYLYYQYHLNILQS